MPQREPKRPLLSYADAVKLATDLVERPGSADARVGRHVTNGAERFVVHTGMTTIARLP